MSSLTNLNSNELNTIKSVVTTLPGIVETNYRTIQTDMSIEISERVSGDISISTARQEPSLEHIKR